MSLSLLSLSSLSLSVCAAGAAESALAIESRGYSGYVPGAPKPRAIVMVGHDSQQCLAALLRARELGEDGGIPLGEIKVLSNRRNKNTLQAIARRHGIEYAYQPAGKWFVNNDPAKGVTRKRQAHLEWVAEQWRTFEPDFVIMSRYLVVLDSAVLGLKPWRVLNLHHGILPAFPGRNALLMAIQSGALFTGATFHFATEDLDQGPTIQQVDFPIQYGPDIDPQNLADLVTANIPLMQETMVIALLHGLGLYVRGRLSFVPNEGLANKRIPAAVLKKERVIRTGESGVDLARFGDFSLYRAARQAFSQSIGL